MLQFTRLMVAIYALTVLGSAAIAQEMVDNPRYLAWAKFKPGTAVTIRHEISMNGGTITETTNKLVEVTAEEVVLEWSATKQLPMPAGTKVQNGEIPTMTKVEYPAKVKKEAMEQPWRMPPETEEKKMLADEDMTVGGKTYRCKGLQVTFVQNEMNFSATFWTCPEVPGDVFKMEQKISGKMEGTTKMVVTAVDVK